MSPLARLCTGAIVALFVLSILDPVGFHEHLQNLHWLLWDAFVAMIIVEWLRSTVDRDQ
jgi:hypothetical protein